MSLHTYPGTVTRNGNPVVERVIQVVRLANDLGVEAKMTVKQKNESYRFVSKSEEVDYLRIIRETPAGVLFVLVEEKTRQNKPKSWSLFVHKKILNNPDLKNKKLGFGKNGETLKIDPDWGEELRIGPSVDPNFRYTYGSGNASGLIKHHVDSVRYHKKRKADRAERDTLTEVQYL